jgi:hypothetical protein
MCAQNYQMITHAHLRDASSAWFLSARLPATKEHTKKSMDLQSIHRILNLGPHITLGAFKFEFENFAGLCEVYRTSRSDFDHTLRKKYSTPQHKIARLETILRDKCDP